VEVEVVIISDDDEKQPAGKTRKKRRKKKPSYFSPSFTFEQAKRFYDEFLEQDSWDPQPEEPFHNNPDDAELSPPVFAHSSDDESNSNDSDTGQPKRARLNPIFKAKMDANLKSASNLGCRKPKAKQPQCS
jgi:hypothetical protein